MVIEYAGIVIRSVLTDKREKYYDGKVGHIWSVNNSKRRKRLERVCFITYIFYLHRVLAVTCSALMTLMWWMQPCMAMQRDSSTTHVNLTATRVWSMWRDESILSSLLLGRFTEGRSSPMTTSSPLKTPATNLAVIAGPGDVGVFSTEETLNKKGRILFTSKP